MSIELEVKSNSLQAQADLRKLNRSVDKISTTTQNATKTLQRLAVGATAAFAAIGSARAITNVTDSYRRLEARIALATDGIENQAAAFKKLNAIALETRSNQEGIADLYSRIARATKVLGIEQAEVIKVTRSISQAITISGSSAESANSAIVQLGQGLAAGALRGQELNSVMEQTPAVAQAIARGMGITIGQLRAFANEGKLTAEAVVSALSSQTESIDKEFALIPVTFAQATQVLGTGVGRIVNEIDKTLNVTRRLSSGMLNLGRSFNAAAEGIGGNVANTAKSLSSVSAEFSRIFQEVNNLAAAFVFLGKSILERALPTDVILAFKAFTENLKAAAVIVSRIAIPLVRFGDLLEIAALNVDLLARSLRIGPFERFARSISFGVFDALAGLQARIADTTSAFSRFGVIFSRSVARSFVGVEFSIRRASIEFRRFGEEVGGVLGILPQLIAATLTGLSNALGLIGDIIRKPFFETVALQFAGLSRIFARFGGEAARAFSEAFVSIFALGTRVTGGDLKGLFKSILDSFESFSFKPIVDGIISTFRSLTSVLDVLFGDPLSDYKSGFEKLGSSIVNVFSSVGSSISDLAEKAFPSLFRSLSLTERLIAAFPSAAKKLEKAFKTVASTFRKTGESIVSLSKGTLKEALNNVRSFGEKIIEIFRKIYIAVIGNSWWTDTIEGVVSLSNKLFGAESRVGKFAKAIINQFKNIENAVKFGFGIAISAVVSSILGPLSFIVSAVGLFGFAIQSGATSLKELGNFSDKATIKLRSLTNEFDLLSSSTKGAKALFSDIGKSGVFDTLILGLKGLQQLLIPLGTILADTFGSAISGAISIALLAALAPFGVFIGIVSTIFSSELRGVIDTFLSTFGTSIQSVLAGFANNAGIIAEKFAEGVIKQIPLILSTLASIGSGIIRGILGSLPLIGPALSGVFSLINTLTLGLAGLFSGGVLAFLIFGGNRRGKAIMATATVIFNFIKGQMVALAAQNGIMDIALFGRAGVSSLVATAKSLIARVLAPLYAAKLSFSVGGFGALGTFLYGTGTSVVAGLTALLAKIGSVLAGARVAFTLGGIGALESFFFGVGGPGVLFAKITAFVASTIAFTKGLFASVIATTRGLFSRLLLGAGGLAGTTAEIGTVSAVASSAFARMKASVVGSFGKGGLMRKLMFGSIGAAALLTGVGAFASDAGDSMTGGILASIGPFLEFGLLAVGIFGTAGIAAASAKILAGVALVSGGILTALTSILVHPVFLTIAAIVAAATVAGALGVYLFGVGDSFGEKLNNAGLQVASFFGLVDAFVAKSERQGILDGLLGDFEIPNLDKLNAIGGKIDSPQETLGELRAVAFTSDEFKRLLDASLELRKANLELKDVNVKGFNGQSRLLDAQRAVVAATLTTNDILNETKERLAARGAEVIGGDRKGFAAPDTKILESVVEVLAKVGDFFGGGTALQEAASNASDIGRAQQGELTQDQSSSINIGLDSIARAQEDFDVEVAIKFSTEIAALEAQLAGISSLDLSLDDQAIETQQITDDLQKAISDGISNVNYKVFLKEAGEAFKEVGLSFSGLELSLISPTDREEIRALATTYNDAVEELGNSTNSTLEGNAQALAAARRALLTGVGTSFDKLQKVLGEIDSEISGAQFANIDVSSIEAIETLYEEIEVTKTKITALNGKELDTEKELRAENEGRKDEIQAILDKTRGLAGVIDAAGLSQKALLGLTAEQTVALAESEDKVRSINKTIADIGPVTNENAETYQIELEKLRAQNKVKRELLDNSRGIAQVLVDTGIAQSNLNGFTLAQVAEATKYKDRISEIKENITELGPANEATLPALIEQNRLLQIEEDKLKVITDSRRSIASLIRDAGINQATLNNLNGVGITSILEQRQALADAELILTRLGPLTADNAEEYAKQSKNIQIIKLGLEDSFKAARSYSEVLSNAGVSQQAITFLTDEQTQALTASQAAIEASERALKNLGSESTVNLDTYRQQLAVLKAQREEQEALLRGTRGIAQTIKDSGLNQAEFTRLTNEQLLAVLESQQATDDIAKSISNLGPLTAETLEAYKEQTRELYDQKAATDALIRSTRNISEVVGDLRNIGINLDLVEFSKQTKEVQAQLLQLQESAQNQALIIANPNSSEAEILAASRAQAELNKQVDNFNELMATSAAASETFRDSFSSAFSDVLRGTESLGDAFKSFIGDLASSVVDAGIANFTDTLFGKTDTDGGLDDKFGSVIGGFGGAIGGAAPNGTEAAPLTVRLVSGAKDALSGLLGGSDKKDDLGSGIADKAAALVGGKDPASAAAEGLTKLTESTTQANGGILGWASNLVQQIASFLGFNVATTTAASANTSAAIATTATTAAVTTLATSATAAAIALQAAAAAASADAAAGIFGFATGGPVRGAGTSTSDSIPAYLSNGEYVINAKATKANKPILDAINSNRDIRKFATGGPVNIKAGEAMAREASSNRRAAGATTNNANITFQVTGDVTEATRRSVREMSQEITTTVQAGFQERGVLNG